MGSKDKYFASRSATHGFDDVGIAQPAGTITAIGNSNLAHGHWVGKLMLTVGDNTLLRVGQAIRTIGLDSGHTGLTRILAIPKKANDGTGKIIVNITYNPLLVDGTGTWAVDGGASAWDTLTPIGADLTGANLAITFWFPDRQGSVEAAVNYKQDILYQFPGIIKTIQISTGGNVRLTRSSTVRPNGSTAQ